MWVSFLAALLVACEGHVRLIHKFGFTRPIRNAAAVDTDGTLSVSGPCGGVQDWGNKTYSTVSPGDNVSFVFAYNGGHQDPNLNMLGVAMSCGRLNNDAVLRNSTVAPTFSPLVNASNSSTAGYPLWVIIPQIPNITNGQYCTISGLDRRGWGGCFDVEIVMPGAPTPAPANALSGVSLNGNYMFGDTQCTPDSPGCCCATGQLQVTHTTGATTANATLRMMSCNSTNLNVTTSFELNQTAANLASLKGSVTVNSRLLSFQVTVPGILMTDDSPIPYFCGSSYAKTGPSPDTSSASVLGVFTAFLVTLVAPLYF